jgi:hypothetical protein
MSFGMVYGSEEHNAPITIFTRGLNIIGLVRTDNDTVPLTSSTFTVFRINYLLEFNDTDRDGRFDPLSPRTDAGAPDSAVKGIELSLDWNLSRIETRRDPFSGRVHWSFSLSKQDILYRKQDGEPERISLSASKEDVLDMVRFDFTITLDREDRTLIFKTYKVRNDDGENILGMERRQMDLQGARLKWKMDHRLLGWDFSPVNRNPSLMLGFNLTFARSYGSRVAMGADLLSGIGGLETEVTIPFSGTRTSIWNMDSNSLRPLKKEVLDEGNISIGDSDWLSRMFWRKDLQRLPSTDIRVPYARLFLYNYDLIGPSSEIWNSALLRSENGLGVMISAGYSYPALRMVVHDPGIETVGFRQPDVRGTSSGGNDPVILEFVKENTTISVVLFIMIVIAAVGIASILTLSRRINMYHDQELKNQQEEELFSVGRRKKDWESLKFRRKDREYGG